MRAWRRICVRSCSRLWRRIPAAATRQRRSSPPISAPTSSIDRSRRGTRRWGGGPYRDRISGGILGDETVFGLRGVGAREGRFKLWCPIAGRYVFFTSRGRLGRFDLRGPTAVCELGTAKVTVRARPGTRVYLIPAGVGPAAGYWGEHIAPHVGDTGEVTFGPVLLAIPLVLPGAAAQEPWKDHERYFGDGVLRD